MIEDEHIFWDLLVDFLPVLSLRQPSFTIAYWVLLGRVEELILA